MRVNGLLQFTVFVCLLFGLPAFSGEGRIPIWESMTITDSGKYILTRDVDGSPGVPVLDVQASDVHIDLNGFRLRADAAPVIRAVGQRNIEIRAGKLAGGTRGIEIIAAPTGGGGVVIENLMIEGWSEVGVYLDAMYNFQILRNVIEGEGSGAIAVVNNVGGWKVAGTIEWNEAKSPIIVRQGANVSIVHNRLNDVVVDQPVDGAIHVDESYGGIIGWNSLHYVDGDGIYVVNSEGVEVRENTVSIAFRSGIVVEADGNAVVQNVVRGCGDHGIFVRRRENHIDRNVLTSNGFSGNGYGLYLEGSAFDNTYGRNTARGNPGGPCFGPTTSDWCDEGLGNSSFGDNYMPNLF
jgi:parallel beta-helix repeat protein